MNAVEFNDVNIRAIFGAEAAEDEDPARLKSYFFKNKSYQNIRQDLPLRILVGHKGIGKSALLKMSHIEDKESGVLSLWIQPNDLAFSEISANNVIQRIEAWKRQITKIIIQKSIQFVNLEESYDQSVLTVTANRIISNIITIFENKSGIEASSVLHDVVNKFRNSPIVRVYIDDIDRGWAATADDIANISALINAARDLSNEDRRIQFRIGLRTDAYYLYRTSDESTDKIEGNVIPLIWDNHDILVVMAKRVAQFHNKVISDEEIFEKKQKDIAIYLHDVIEGRFAGKGHWDKAPIHIVLLSLTRKRPRDLVKLLSGAAREAYRNNHTKITSSDLENTFSHYSNERIQDLILEFRSEVPQIERLLYGMKPTESRVRANKRGFLYQKDELMIKLRNIISTSGLSFKNGKPVTTSSIAEFLFKIDFILARCEHENGKREWLYFDQNRMLQSQFVDFGYLWEVHPAYRWALNPRRITAILDEMDLSA